MVSPSGTRGTGLAAFQLYESGARTGKKTDIEKAKAKIDQGDIDLKLIRDLKQP